MAMEGRIVITPRPQRSFTAVAFDDDRPTPEKPLGPRQQPVVSSVHDKLKLVQQGKAKASKTEIKSKSKPDPWKRRLMDLVSSPIKHVQNSWKKRLQSDRARMHGWWW